MPKPPSTFTAAISSRMMAKLSSLFLAALALSVHVSNADSTVRATQEALKEQGFYYGNVDGIIGSETSAALRRFQIQRGLDVSGKMDSRTLQLLQSSPAEGDAIPVRERIREVIAKDQEFLERDGGHPAAARPGSLPRETPPAPVSTSPFRQRPSPRSSTEPADFLSQSDAQQFVKSYLAAAEEPTPEREIGFYADRVNYFDSGEVSHDFVARDQRRYYKRWPSRKFTLLDNPKIIDSDSSTATINFRISYQVGGAGRSTSGRTENIMRVRQTKEGPRIISIDEKKIRD